MSINRFNIRVYFVVVSKNDSKILLIDELIKSKPYTKFPGGGLEFGEGPEDCALREAIEELGQEIKIISHLYTTGFFQQSFFKESDQIISIYYLAELISEPRFTVSTTRFDFKADNGHQQSFRWVNKEDLNEEDFELPIDKHVVKLLKNMALH